MSSSKRFETGPSFTLIELMKERIQIEKEIIKVNPEIEVSLEGLSELATGRFVDWDATRKLFIVRWKFISDSFKQKTESQIGLRAYFKCTLFTTQLVFKTTTVRRLEDGDYQYRLPDFIFKKQKRGALRVPIAPHTAFLECAEGRFEIVDLSASGMRLRIHAHFKPTSLFTEPSLILNSVKLKNAGLQIKVLRREKDFLGCKFLNFSEQNKVTIKQFLIDSLRVHFKGFA